MNYATLTDDQLDKIYKSLTTRQQTGQTFDIQEYIKVHEEMNNRNWSWYAIQTTQSAINSMKKDFDYNFGKELIAAETQEQINKVCETFKEIYKGFELVTTDQQGKAFTTLINKNGETVGGTFSLLINEGNSIEKAKAKIDIGKYGGTMKTILPASIQTVYEAKKFLTDLAANCEAYHPEDNAKECLYPHIATEQECIQLDKLMNDIYCLKGNNNAMDMIFDPCQFLLELDPDYLTDISIADIKPNAKFKTETGIIWIIDSIENGLVRTSMEHGQKGNYRDRIETVVDFLNEENSIKL